MKTKAAVLHAANQEWAVEEVELGEPTVGEVQVRLVASGLCHSDHHLRTGSSPIPFPIVGGHEAAGVVTKVGPGVADVAVGDHVVTAFIPACGTCRPCSAGFQNLCDKGATLLTGAAISDGSFRVTQGDTGLVQMCLLGTFSPYITVNQASLVKIEKDIPLRDAALLGCAVATGWGSVNSAGGARPGDAVVVIGVGGVGIHAVQGAVAGGARLVIAIDPGEFKRQKALEFGATHVFGNVEEAMQPVADLTWGELADVTVITVGEMDGRLVQPAMEMTGKNGTVVVTAMGHHADDAVSLKLYDLTLLQKRLQGAVFGGRGPHEQVHRLLQHYRSGSLKLGEAVTRTYRLEQVNEGYDDMLNGKNLRGIIVYDDADY